MKDLIKIFVKDYQEEGFTCKEYIMYGIAVPVLLILATGIGELINQL